MSVMVLSSFKSWSAPVSHPVMESTHCSEIVVRYVQGGNMTSMRLLALEDSVPRIDPSDGCRRLKEDSLGLKAPSAGIEKDATRSFHQPNAHG